MENTHRKHIKIKSFDHITMMTFTRLFALAFVAVVSGKAVVISTKKSTPQQVHIAQGDMEGTLLCCC